MANQFKLLETRRFLPLFLTQFLGAFNDNVFKNALVVLVTYVIATRSGLNAQILVTVAAGIFILPYVLFSALAGLLADRYDKARLIRYVKLAEIVLMLLAALGFYLESVGFLMAVLFLMGTQSTFFGPLKYGILPDQLDERELIGGNALISAATYLAILTGMILGTLLVVSEGAPRTGGVLAVSLTIVAMAVLGWTSSLFIPPTRAANPELSIGWNLASQTVRIVAHAASRRDVFLCILGISWFWLVGATFLAQLPTLAKDFLGGDERVFTLLMTVFSIGIGVGSLLCNRLLKGAVHATYVPLGALGITLFTVDLFVALQEAPLRTSLVGIDELLATPQGWRIVIDLTLIAISGGIYIVPLNALLQNRSDPAHRARNIACNNILNALFMVVSAAGTTMLLGLGWSVPAVLLLMAAVNLAVAVYICRLLPGALVKSILAWLLDLVYRVDVEGISNYEAAGKRVLIVPNHQSYLDALLIAAYVPDSLTFAVNTHVSQRNFIKFFLALAETFPVDPTKPLAMRSLIDCVKQDRRVVIFPEGRITVTGSLMKVYEGPGMVADKSGATLLPVRIDGAQFSTFSRLRGKVHIRWFPKIRVQFMEPVKFDIPAEILGRRRRHLAGDQLYGVMSSMIFESSDYHRTLFSSLVDARAVHGSRHLVLDDYERQPLTYGRLITTCFVLARQLARGTHPGERVGVLLPNMVGTAVTFFALQAIGRIPAMLNFSTGARNVALACKAATIKTVYTSRRFVETAKLTDMLASIAESGAKTVFLAQGGAAGGFAFYLEDLRGEISLLTKLTGWVAGKIPRIAYRLAHGKRDPHAPCVVLFTSGTEGAPKGVVLTHVNLQSNRYQVSSRIDFGPTDIVFNALPMFHSFGLTCATILPLLSGLRTFLYPSPLHYRIVPELAYDTNATIMFGTDTFLSGYARFAHPYDFYSMRYVFAGAEKVKEETRRIWSERFGVRIFEGYGATETSPAISMNTPMHNRPGSVGRIFPGIEHRLEPVPGIDEGGRLSVKGPNVMAGYLLADDPGILHPPEDGWYDTGDIVEIDADGFVFIKGRAKRFAKIGGEMVSLAAVESLAASLWPDRLHAVVSLPDPRKGEQLVLVTEQRGAEREALSAFARRQGMAELGVPRTIVEVDKMPLLGSGKVDYVTVKSIAEKRVT